MELFIIIIIGLIYGLYALIPKNKKHRNRTHTMSKQIIRKPKLNVKQIDISNIKLSIEQQKLFEHMEDTKNHIFITGKAGTGKSVLLQYFKLNSAKQLAVVAPTGVAALNVGGQTIHSFFKLPPQFITKETLKLTAKTALLLRNLDTIVIDEISMVRADLMDGINYLLQMARSNDLPFGGVQIVMFGDLYQLPPIVQDPQLHKYFADHHGGHYFFHAHAWQNTPLEIYELSEIFRQKDDKFKDILNAIRIGKVTEEALASLNQRVIYDLPEEGIINIVTTNHLVNEINNHKLDQLNREIREYRATITGELEQSAFPTEELLRLKKGAQVMLIKNDREKRWVNGTIGYIDSMSEDEIIVDIDGFKYSVPRETWNKIRYYYDVEKRRIEEEVVSSFTQFPLRLAWAITIHKSQGQTYGSVAVNMGDGAFAHGQTYVALSRCKSLEGLYLKREILPQDIMVDPTIVDFMKRVSR